MGREKRLVPRGKYILRRTSTKDETRSIYIQYVFNRTPICRPIANYRCKEKDWNVEGNLGRGELKSSYGSDFKRVNNYLSNKVADIDNLIIQYCNAHPNQLTVQVIRDILDGKPLTRQDQGKDLAEMADEITEDLYKEHRITHSTYKNRLCAMKKFRKFYKYAFPNKPIFIGDVKHEVVGKYIQWRQNIEGNSYETINHSLTPLIDACERAADLGLIDKSEFVAIKNKRLPKVVTFNTECEDADIKYLTKSELKTLVEYIASVKQPRRRDYLDMFMFSFHACGLRVVDVMTLQWRHIDFAKRQIRKILVKTANYKGTTQTIPLTDTAIEILNRWKERTGRSRFVFGLLEEDFNLDDRESLYKARNNVTKCINQSLVVVGENLKFKHPLTMHVARHSFAVMALNDGLQMSVVSRLLGHASTSVTEKVYAKYLPETLEEEINKLDFTPFAV